MVSVHPFPGSAAWSIYHLLCILWWNCKYSDTVLPWILLHHHHLLDHLHKGRIILCAWVFFPLYCTLLENVSWAPSWQKKKKKTKLSTTETSTFISVGTPWCNSRSSSWWSGLTSKLLLSIVTSISIAVLCSVWSCWITMTSGSTFEWRIPSSVSTKLPLSKTYSTSVITGFISVTSSSASMNVRLIRSVLLILSA